MKESCLQSTKETMLQMICGKTLKDGISNETIRDMTGVEKIEFLRKQKLRWFEHMERIDDEELQRKQKSL